MKHILKNILLGNEFLIDKEYLVLLLIFQCLFTSMAVNFQRIRLAFVFIHTHTHRHIYIYVYLRMCGFYNGY